MTEGRLINAPLTWPVLDTDRKLLKVLTSTMKSSHLSSNLELLTHMAAVGPRVRLLHVGDDDPGHHLSLGLLIRLNPESWITVENLSHGLTMKFLEPFYICCGINYIVNKHY